MTTLTPQEYARRLIRSRNWHQVRAGRCRQEVAAHEREADRLEAEIRELGFDPQPPFGPRVA